ncbi:hypothetical protein HMPREF9323_1984 [Veillonella parvula ACS-068-V-Sch12]|uniref:hypothetical protein n=1 Tax=Veillonella parvula TaxID=29466 RepID=UPI00020F05C7|nr:hypothetical protein [Veillonella parvula]EGL76755.1 hypothetical protein HMPREF9323_1984 [Veillonella parvula ACS-068-V-Sch12]
MIPETDQPMWDDEISEKQPMITQNDISDDIDTPIQNDNLDVSQLKKLLAEKEEQQKQQQLTELIQSIIKKELDSLDEWKQSINASIKTLEESNNQQHQSEEAIETKEEILEKQLSDLKTLVKENVSLIVQSCNEGKPLVTIASYGNAILQKLNQY